MEFYLNFELIPYESVEHQKPNIPVLGPPHPPNTADCSDVTNPLKTFQVAAIGQAREKDKGISEQNLDSQLSKGVQFSYGLAWFSIVAWHN